MKIVFMGTPVFCIPILEEIIKKHEIVLLVTQPDKLVGRKRTLTFPKVKEFGIANGIEVYQPNKIRKEYDYILKYDFDIIVTCAYGQIIPKELLNYPKYKAINIHASLLPYLRGGAPIHKAIIDGYQETGITIMYMNEFMDQGDILFQDKIKIEEDDTYLSLHDKLSYLAKKNINKYLELIKENKITPVAQLDIEATYAYNITREEEKVNFNNDSKNIYNHIRGLNPSPGAYITLNNENIKVYESIIIDYEGNEEPGEILSEKEFLVKTKDKAIKITKLQLSGKNIISDKDFLNGKGRNLIKKGYLIK